MAPKAGEAPAWTKITKEQTQQIMCDIIASKRSGYPVIKFFNSHLEEAYLDGLIGKAERGELKYTDFDDRPLYHHYRPAKAEGFYGQYKGSFISTQVYCHTISALCRSFHEHEDYKNGLDVWSAFSESERKSVIEVRAFACLLCVCKSSVVPSKAI